MYLCKLKLIETYTHVGIGLKILPLAYSDYMYYQTALPTTIRAILIFQGVHKTFQLII